jgi:hypothetical protein
MLEFLLERSTVITLAVIGGVLSLLVSGLTGRGTLSPKILNIINKASYLFMMVSVVLFIAAGLIRLQGG